MEDGLAVGEVVGQQFPGSSGAEVVEDGVEDLASVDGWPSALFGAGFGPGDQGFQTLPLSIGQIGRVGFAAHTHTLKPTGSPHTRPVFRCSLTEPADATEAGQTPRCNITD